MSNAPCITAPIDRLGNARVPATGELVYTHLIEQLRTAGPTHLGFDHKTVIAMHDAYPDTATRITPQVELLRRALQSRTLTDIIACLGAPASAHACASGVHALRSPWQAAVVQVLCAALIAPAAEQDVIDAARATNAEDLGDAFLKATGIGRASEPCMHTIRALPAMLRTQLAIALLARADTWARIFASTRPPPTTACSNAQVTFLRHMALTNASAALGTQILQLVDHPGDPAYTPFLSLLRAQRGNDNAANAANAPVSYYTLFKGLSMLATAEPAGHGTQHDVAGALTALECREVIAHLHEEAIKHGTTMPTAIALARFFQAEQADIAAYLRADQRPRDLRGVHHQRLRLRGEAYWMAL